MNKPQIQFRPEEQKPLVLENRVFWSANCFQLNEEDKKRARIELFETEEKRNKCIQELKDRIAKDGINCRTDDSYLLRHLRVRKFNCDKAYHNIKQTDIFKRKYPEYFLLEPNLTSLLNRNFLQYLPYADEDGNIFFWLDAEKWDPLETSFEELLQVSTAVCDLIIENPKCQVNGIIGVYDFKGVSRHHISSLISNSGLTKYSFILQSLYPWRIKKALILNTGPLARFLYNLARPFLSRKITKRVVLLGSDMSELHQHVNPVLLPKKLGGTLDDGQCSITQKVIDNIPFLKYERSFKD